jgi:putative tricarboxylic transport membrane protein
MLAVFVIGLFVVAVARTIPMGLYKSTLGPRAFFFGVGGMFIVGGGVLLLQRLRNWKAQNSHTIPSEGEEDEEGYPASALRAASVIAASLVYALLLRPLGYLLTTPLYIAGTLVILGQRQWRWIVLFAVGLTVVFYIAFAQVLKSSVPVGPLTELFRDLGWIVL